MLQSGYSLTLEFDRSKSKWGEYNPKYNPIEGDSNKSKLK
jgi:hypothetical protein